MSIKKILLAVAISTAFFGTAANAQVKDDPVLKACEQVADKAKRLELENQELKIKLAGEQEKNAIGQQRIALLQEQASSWENALKKSKELDTNSQLIIFNLKEQIADYRLRVKDLENENNKLRSSRWTRSVISFGAGVGAGFLINK